MPIPTDRLRKAAILVASLDTQTADALLEQMPEGQAALVRRLMVDLDEIDPAEQNEVIGEFVGRPSVATAEVELSDSLARRLAADGADSLADFPLSNTPPFGFLQQAASEKLSPFLAGEHPQTIALVISHLPPQRAAGVLATLAGPLQADVVRRLIDLDQADPVMLREVERGLQSRILAHISHERRRAAGLAAVTSILKAAGPRLKHELLSNLSLHDQSLANKLAPPAPRQLTSLEQLSANDLVRLLEMADPEVGALALTGASASLIERVLAELPAGDARLLRQALENPGPIRLSDVEEAQQRLMDLACDLAAQGRLSISPAASLVAAA